METMGSSRLITVGLIVCNVILIVLVLIFAGSGGPVSEEKCNALDARVKKLEQQMVTKQFDRDKLNEKIAGFDNFVNAWKDRKEALLSRIRTLEESVAALKSEKTAKQQPESAAAEKKSTEKPKAEASEPTDQKTDAAAQEGPAAYYEVQKGDTVYSISRKYGMKPEALRKLNDMDSNKIVPGQKLRIQ